MADLEKQFMKDYRLTTAEILYHLPDYPKLLQTYIWQEYDLAPKFPVLKEFIGFWEKEIEADIHSIIMANTEIITPSDHKFYNMELTLN